jgi:hypothetical protein
MAGHSDDVTAVAVSTDRRRAVSASNRRRNSRRPAARGAWHAGRDAGCGAGVDLSAIPSMTLGVARRGAGRRLLSTRQPPLRQHRARVLRGARRGFWLCKPNVTYCNVVRAKSKHRAHEFSLVERRTPVVCDEFRRRLDYADGEKGGDITALIHARQTRHEGHIDSAGLSAERQVYMSITCSLRGIRV